MIRLVFALLVVLAAAAFAGTASAHVHGGGRGTAITASATISPRPAGTPAEISAATPVDDGCDRDCGHTPGMGGCLCTAACAAVALPDLPALVPHPVRATRPSGDSPVWRATTRGPPTPPPRA